MMSRRAKINSHVRARVTNPPQYSSPYSSSNPSKYSRNFKQDRAERDEAWWWTSVVRGPKSGRGPAAERVGIKQQMKIGAISKLQPYHLPFIFCYAFALYFLSLPLEFPSDSDSSTSTCPPFTPTFLVNLRQFLLLPSPFFVIDNVVSNSTANISPSILFGPIARIPPSLLGRAGTALVGVLSMVLGLLLSYTYSAALGRWEKGKEKWSEVRREIRDGIRFVSLINPISMKAGNKNRDGDRYTFSPMTESHAFADFDKSPINDEENDGDDENDSVQERAEQITALLVAFAFALHHHLERSRPLISQAPLCDLLPVGYISSVKRTGRVRFSDNEIKGPRFEEKDRLKGKQEADSDRSRVKNAQVGRDRRRSHSGVSAATAKLGQRSSPDGLVSRQPDSTNSAASSKLESDINHKSSQVDDGGPEYSTEDDGIEAALILQEPPADVIDQQVRQLNLPKPEIVAQSEKTVSPVDFLAAVTDETPRVMHRYPPARPVLANPFPSNLPLSILRILEAYVHGMIKEGKSAKSDRSGSGWSAPQGERGLNMVKNLSKLLSETEHLSHDPPPLTLSIHLSHLLLIYLLAIPASLIPLLGAWTPFVSVIAAWALLGVEAMSREVGAVFGSSENHLPTQRYCSEILSESLDMSPLFNHAYLQRLRARVRPESDNLFQVSQDPHERAQQDVIRSLETRRVEDWLPDFAE